MDATTLICLILLLIGVGLAIYYAVLCLQSRPKTEKRPCHPDMGPLLQEQDLNGNHEDVPSRPVVSLDQPDSAPEKPERAPGTPPLGAVKEAGLEPPLKSVTFQTTPECAAKSPKEGSVILPIDDEPSFQNSSKPLLHAHEPPGVGLVRPPARPLQHPPPPQSASAPIAQDPHYAHPVPIVVSENPLKAMSVSYEEDGLLVPGSAPRNLNADVRPKVPMGQPVMMPMSARTPQPHHGAYSKQHPKQVQFINPFVASPFIVNPDQLRPQQVDIRPQHIGVRPQQVDFRPQQVDIRPQQVDSRPQQPEMKPQPENLKSPQEDSKPQQPDTRPQQDDSKAQEDDSKPQQPDTRPHEDDSKPQQPDTRPQRPVLNSPHSDPGSIGEVKQPFVFGTRPRSDENLSGYPAKKTKLSPKEDFEPESKETSSQEDMADIPSQEPKEEPSAQGNCSNPTVKESEDSPKAEEEKTEKSAKETDSPPPVGWSIVPMPVDASEEMSPAFPDEVVILEKLAPIQLEVEPTRVTEDKLKDQSPDVLPQTADKRGNDQPHEKDDSADGAKTHEKDQPTEGTPPSPEDRPIEVTVNFVSDEERPDSASIDSQEETTSDSSDPDVTEYSFQSGPHEVSTATVLANEVSNYSEDRIGLTNYVPLSESTPIPSNKPSKTIGHPPTPTSDTTKSPSPFSNDDLSLEEIDLPINPSALGTPPVTPPEGKTSPFIIENTATDISPEAMPTYIVIEPHNSRERLSSASSSSGSSSSSSSLSSSSSASNGSYKIDVGREEKLDLPLGQPDPQIKGPRIKK